MSIRASPFDRRVEGTGPTDSQVPFLWSTRSLVSGLGSGRVGRVPGVVSRRRSRPSPMTPGKQDLEDSREERPPTSLRRRWRRPDAGEGRGPGTSTEGSRKRPSSTPPSRVGRVGPTQIKWEEEESGIERPVETSSLCSDPQSFGPKIRVESGKTLVLVQ